jgi:hypothetical protein
VSIKKIPQAASTVTAFAAWGMHLLRKIFSYRNIAILHLLDDGGDSTE